MAQQLQSINLVAPAFKGINTEDSPLTQDPSFAEVADNAVIDKRGRIAARKGNDVLTTDKTALGTDSINGIHQYRDDEGNKVVFSVGNNKIFTGTTTLTEQTLGSYTITDNNWKMVTFNGHAYFFQRGHEPLVYQGVVTPPDTPVVEPMTTHAHFHGPAPHANEVLAAYGRLWAADFENDKSTVYWSRLLIGHDWGGTGSGSIDISDVWPDGYDEIVALAAHNNHLLIFGKHSIVVYQNATSPANMSLADTISGIGCVDRDTVQYTGTDVIFLSQTGLKSFGRTIQEKSMPISSLSGSITRDLLDAISEEDEGYSSVYSPENNFYLLTFQSQDLTYCFDVRGTLENGSYRVTRWPFTGFKCYERLDNGVLYVGSSEGIGQYSGYSDNGNSYKFSYFSPSLTFGDPSRVKLLKKLRPTLIGGRDTSTTLSWAYDFDESYNTATVVVGRGAESALFGSALYGVSKFTGGVKTSRTAVNTTGGGGTIVIGVEADINGKQLSLQEINVLALMGKVI